MGSNGLALGLKILAGQINTLGDIHSLQSAIKQLQGSSRLVIRHLMAGLIDPGEGEITDLSRLAQLGPIDDERHIAGLAEAGRGRIVGGEGDGLPPEPITDVVGVAIDQRHTHGQVENLLEIGEEIRPGLVAGLLEGKVHGVIGHGVVQVDAEGVFHGGLLEIRQEVLRRSRVVGWMADVVDAAAAELVVRALDVVAAHVGGFGAEGVVGEGGAVGGGAQGELVLAAVGHAVGKPHVVVDGLVDGLDAVGVVVGEFRVVVGLDGFVDNAVDDS